MLHSKKACYWKPVQSGQDEIDLNSVQHITGMAVNRFLPSAYNLAESLSPHESARREGVKISLDKITCPKSAEPVIIEGAGGLLVPLNDKEFMVDLMISLGFPVVLVCRTGLGTINHTLMSLEILRSRGLAVVGVILNGDPVEHNRIAIEQFGRTRIIGEIPILDKVRREDLNKISPEVELGL